MNTEVKYIPEQKAWLVNGHLIQEEGLTQEERTKLMEACTGNFALLNGNDSLDTQIHESRLV